MDVMEYGYDQIRGGPTLAVSLGDSVEITLTNKGKLTHEFIMIDSETLRTTLKEGAVGRAELQEALDEPLTTVIEGAAILNLEPGETETITFVADKPGRYLFACFRDGPDGVNHVYRQMWGEFSVVPPQP